jgi:hypothetical protein
LLSLLPTRTPNMSGCYSAYPCASLKWSCVIPSIYWDWGKSRIAHRRLRKRKRTSVITAVGQIIRGISSPVDMDRMLSQSTSLR